MSDLVVKIISGFAVQKRFVSVHSIFNKAAGALLFLLPLTIPAVTLKYSAIAVSAAAAFAAIQDDRFIKTDREDKKTMKFKGTLIVVKDCNEALKFYQNLFGFQLIRDNDGNMELSENLYLQEEKYWERFTGRRVVPQSNQTELYFEEPDIESFVKKLERLYPDTKYVNHLMTHSWGQRVVRFYDPDGCLIEVGTPV